MVRLHYVVHLLEVALKVQLRSRSVVVLEVAHSRLLPHTLVLEDLRPLEVVVALAACVSSLRRALSFRTCCKGVMVDPVKCRDSVVVLRVNYLGRGCDVGRSLECSRRGVNGASPPISSDSTANKHPKASDAVAELRKPSRKMESPSLE